jgi:SAM-dependent methyltransferase
MFYDFSKAVGQSINGDIEYYSKKLEKVSGLVLEAGVGTGRMLIPLIKKGIRTIGVDSSPEMLEQCKINLKKHKASALLYEQDLIELSTAEKYDAIIMPAGSFCLLPREKAEIVLHKYYEHLNPGGKIIIDLEEAPVSFVEGAETLRVLQLSADRALQLCSRNGGIDWLAQETSYINRYELIEKGKVIQTEISNLSLFWYELEEFKMLLILAGYEDISCETGYGRPEGDFVTFIAYKPDNLFSKKKQVLVQGSQPERPVQSMFYAMIFL